MRTAAEDMILLNCLEWQHKHLLTAMGVSSGVDKYPTLNMRQQQITEHMQAALEAIEELQHEVEADAIVSTNSK